MMRGGIRMNAEHVTRLVKELIKLMDALGSKQLYTNGVDELFKELEAGLAKWFYNECELYQAS
ncbi:MAG: hypothetical protein OD815_000831 [Candidatus Alkanophagales archaeon MCA70_species_2]|nr:hypothetical protein [Candidatus Alkanophaga liquidiphilum]